ncbi:VOC family protein [Caldimonas sp. KR1-144]|uniref:VOC family protein n=1 Tax=Caldimonas sp. KR1-144 TaxID=3400911 RepID=UPI003C08E799
MPMLELDHLVVAAPTLADGVAWCEAVLGVTPAAGGRHALMSTHNRLLRLDGETWPRAYLEIIAIDPEAPPPGRARWFDLDDECLQSRLREYGPQLVHWVARTPDLEAALAERARAGHDGGRILAASRETPNGLLRWRIAVRHDGARDLPLPTLIEWGAVHPWDALPAAGVALVGFEAGAEGLVASLQCPAGLVTLRCLS